MQERNWFTYLNFWCNQKKPIGSGLSIPFLIGIELITKKENYSIKTFLLELKNTKLNSQVLCLRYCPNIGEIVCCIDTMTISEKAYYHYFDNLFFSIPEFNDVPTYEIFEKKLIEKFEKYIQKRQFTIKNGKWEQFSAENIEEINSQIC